MITLDNYTERISPELLATFPKEMIPGHELLIGGKEFYNEDQEVKELIDDHLEMVNLILSKQKKKAPSKSSQAETPKVRKAPQKVKRAPRAKPKVKEKEIKVDQIFHEDKDYYFIKRFVNLLKRPKSRHQIGLYIKALQKAIIAREIRKTSQYADHLMLIQEKLCTLFNKMKSNQVVTPEIDPQWHQELENIVSGEKVYKSVLLMKRYIGLLGSDDKRKIGTLSKAIDSAFKRKTILKTDPFYDEINKIKQNLSNTKGEVQIEQPELSGLQGIISQYEASDVSGCNCEGPVNSLEFAEMSFETLGFQGRWKEFIGDPTHGFRALIYGKPKSGKSTLCAQFAKYLADHHGKVLYVAKEEGKTGLLQERLKRVGALVSNLDIDDQIREEAIKNYDFLILDSVQKLGMNEEQLDELPAKYPNIKGFLFIMHSTKGGDFRGSQTFAHDVDVLIDVERGGIARQIGRFAQGSEMQIDFDNLNNAA